MSIFGLTVSFAQDPYEIKGRYVETDNGKGVCEGTGNYCKTTWVVSVDGEITTIIYEAYDPDAPKDERRSSYSVNEHPFYSNLPIPIRLEKIKNEILLEN